MELEKSMNIDWTVFQNVFLISSVDFNWTDFNSIKKVIVSQEI